uniref:Uncharacterized protein n=1 Tax=Zea mays TaxID=4577 RepID=B6UAA2_MAIZE|nr:hypothetical protein [Zea mays]
MADDSGTVGMAIGTAVGGTSIALFTGVSCWLGMKAYRDGRFSRGWWRMRVCTLGGVTTLGQALAYDCAMCGRSRDPDQDVFFFFVPFRSLSLSALLLGFAASMDEIIDYGLDVCL